METVLKISGLNKQLGNRKILHNINMETYAGEVFGFLGPNGAGKTTTIKIIVGLLALDEGEIEINGISLKKNFEGALQHIGAIVENPEMYKNMTGMQNLRQCARIRTTKENPIDQKRIDEVVHIVGLSNRINETVKKYSLGMRQRLGVAQALLHRPKLMILDEPTNGLDPAGIKELRDILKHAAHQEGIGVLVSSHLMSEMELMCDRVGIIVNGVVSQVTTVKELIESTQGDFVIYAYQVDNADNAIAALDTIDDDKKAKADDGTIHIVLERATAEDVISDLTTKLVLAGVKIKGVNLLEQKTLEDAFIEITKSGGKQIG